MEGVAAAGGCERKAEEKSVADAEPLLQEGAAEGDQGGEAAQAMEAEDGEGQGPLTAELRKLLEQIGVHGLDEPRSTLAPENAFDAVPGLHSVAKMAAAANIQHN